MPGRGDEKFKIVKVDEKARSCLQITMGFFNILPFTAKKQPFTTFGRINGRNNR